MKGWKEVIAASPAESLIRSDHILRNAQRYERTGCVSFPSNFFLCILAPLTLCIPALLVINAFPWASCRPGHSVQGKLAAPGVFCDVDDSREAYIMLSLSVSHPPPLSPLQILQAEELCHTQCEQQSLIVSSQHLWLQSIWNLNLWNDKVTR